MSDGKALILGDIGAPDTAEWRPEITGFAVARTTLYGGRPIYVPIDVQGNALEGSPAVVSGETHDTLAWDANWKLVDARSLWPVAPDSIALAAAGFPEGAQRTIVEAVAPVEVPAPIVIEKPQDVAVIATPPSPEIPPPIVGSLPDGSQYRILPQADGTVSAQAQHASGAAHSSQGWATVSDALSHVEEWLKNVTERIRKAL